MGLELLRKKPYKSRVSRVCANRKSEKGAKKEQLIKFLRFLVVHYRVLLASLLRENICVL